jgi:hypothetical protein
MYAPEYALAAPTVMRHSPGLILGHRGNAIFRDDRG